MTGNVPLIDIFAGCGGLSEGFLQKDTGDFFELALAVDSDPWAHATHQLRAFFHQFKPGAAPEEYYELLRGNLDIDQLFSAFPEEARRAQQVTLRWELGGEDFPDAELHKNIESAIGDKNDWVLVGGPPCQAYSIAGRARNKGKADYVAAEDHRHFLYKEYLKILHQYRPSVFVMENVKGLLNSKIDGRHIWQLMLEDLIDPSAALGETISNEQAGRKYDGYRIYSLVTPDRGLDIFGIPQIDRDEYIVPCEDFGIPQTRHRVLLFGVRADIDLEPQHLARQKARIPAGKVLSDLPPVRSGLSKREDSDANWLETVQEIAKSDWLKRYDGPTGVKDEINRVIKQAVRKPRASRGSNFVKRTSKSSPKYRSDWYSDERLGGICNHESKAHMDSDLHRYMFASCYAKTEGEAIKLNHFPTELLPDHENVKVNGEGAVESSDFVDRFSVQLKDRPSRTIVSHIAKDGHYFIHYDAAQCRSFTVREAARIQTFPDNFYFLGGKTEQYRQVGNAVPPLLSYQIAEIVRDLLERAGRAS